VRPERAPDAHTRNVWQENAFAAAVALLAGVLVAGLAACGGGGATFSPTGACLADGRIAGAYPELEALVPRALEGAPAKTTDSGRSCSTTALGTLTSHDVHDLRFAGSTWDLGGGSGTSIAVLALPTGRLPVEWVQEFYTAGALNGSKTDNVKTSHPTFDGVADAFRVDALNDLSQQAIVIWALGDRVRVVIVATHVDPNASMAGHEARVRAAVAAAVAVVSAP
jgi:hypothetical protein